MSMPAARVTWQATVRWEGVAQVQQPSAAAVKARHTATVHLNSRSMHECTEGEQSLSMHESIFLGTHLDPMLLQLLSSVVCHKAVLALRLLTEVMLLPAGRAACLNDILLSTICLTSPDTDARQFTPTAHVL